MVILSPSSEGTISPEFHTFSPKTNTAQMWFKVLCILDSVYHCLLNTSMWIPQSVKHVRLLAHSQCHRLPSYSKRKQSVSPSHPRANLAPSSRAVASQIRLGSVHFSLSSLSPAPSNCHYNPPGPRQEPPFHCFSSIHACPLNPFFHCVR